MLRQVKLALRVSSTAFDSELDGLIAAAQADLGLAGIRGGEGDPLIERAIITYCRVNFGQPEDYDRLKKSYDEQKAQFQMAAGYGLPEEANG